MNIKFKLASSMLFIFAIILIFSLYSALAHSGRTDSKGGHKDNQNASGLGSYHYHHGEGPHLHPGGVCPFSVTVKPVITLKPTAKITAVIVPTATQKVLDTLKPKVTAKTIIVTQKSAVATALNITEKPLGTAKPRVTAKIVFTDEPAANHEHGEDTHTHDEEIIIDEPNTVVSDVDLSNKEIEDKTEPEEESSVASTLLGGAVLIGGTIFAVKRRKKKRK